MFYFLPYLDLNGDGQLDFAELDAVMQKEVMYNIDKAKDSNNLTICSMSTTWVTRLFGRYDEMISSSPFDESDYDVQAVYFLFENSKR